MPAHRPRHLLVRAATAAAGVFLLFFLVSRAAVIATAAAAGFFLMVMITTAATAGIFLMMVMATAAATAGVFFMMVMTATAAAFIMVMVAATTAAFIVVMVTATTAATAAATAAAAHLFEADTHERFVDFGHFKTDHAEHLGDVGHGQHGKTFGSFGNRNATGNERLSGLLQSAHITADVQNTFNSRTHNPEIAFVVHKHIVHFKRTAFFNGNVHGAFCRFKNITPLSTLLGCQHDIVSTIKDRLRRLSISRKEFRQCCHSIHSLN